MTHQAAPAPQALPEWDLTDLYPGRDSEDLKADLAKLAAEAEAFKRLLPGQGRRAGRRGLRRGDQGLRGAVGTAGQADELCLSGLCRGRLRPGDRPLLPGHAGEGHRRGDQAAVLHPGDQPADRRGTRREGARQRRRPLLSVAARRTGLPRPRVVRRSGKADGRKGRHRAVVLGAAVRPDHGRAAVRRRRQGLDGDRGARPPVARRPRGADEGGQGAGQRARRQHEPVLADHQHAGQGQGDRRRLAQVPRPAGLAPSGQPGRAGGGRRPGLGDQGRLSQARPPLLRDEGRVDGAGEAGILGPQRPAARRRRPQVLLGRGARYRADRLRAFLPRPRGGGPAVLRQRLDRRTDPARQGVGRLRPSHRALGPPLPAAQLHGQDPRRDDARPRTRPWGAPGAVRRPGRADGRHPADPRRDRLGVRRDADLPLAARPRARSRPAAA